jgi:hypothetical protein
MCVTPKPQIPALERKGAAFVRRVLSRHRIPARKKRNQSCWEFDTIGAVQWFERSLQEMMSRYRTRILTYAGEL